MRSASVLEFLSQHYLVDVITFQQPDEESPAGFFPPGRAERLTTIKLPRHSRQKWVRALRNARRLMLNRPPLLDRFSGFAAAISAFIAGRRYDVGIIEHFWCAPYHQQLRPHCRLLALDLHNIESVWHERMERSSGSIASFAHARFARAYRELEKTWLPRFDVLLTTSDSDASLLRSIAGPARVTVYPNAIPSSPEPARSDEDVIIFSGNLEYHPNISAVRFFRDRIWSSLRERWPSLTWRIAGKNQRAIAGLVQDDPRIELTGPMHDAIAEIARAKVAVVPLLAGSGTRVKILEAWAAGTPVVSTSIGAEGLNCQAGVHLLIADEPQAFGDAISSLLSSTELRKRLGQAGRQLCQDSYTWETARMSLGKALGRNETI